MDVAAQLSAWQRPCARVRCYLALSIPSPPPIVSFPFPFRQQGFVATTEFLSEQSRTAVLTAPATLAAKLASAETRAISPRPSSSPKRVQPQERSPSTTASPGRCASKPACLSLSLLLSLSRSLSRSLALFLSLTLSLSLAHETGRPPAYLLAFVPAQTSAFEMVGVHRTSDPMRRHKACSTPALCAGSVPPYHELPGHDVASGRRSS